MLHKQTRRKSHTKQNSRICSFTDRCCFCSTVFVCIGAHTDNSRRSSCSGKICIVFLLHIKLIQFSSRAHTDCYWSKWKQVPHTLKHRLTHTVEHFTCAQHSRYDVCEQTGMGNSLCTRPSGKAKQQKAYRLLRDNTILFQRILCTVYGWTPSDLLCVDEEANKKGVGKRELKKNKRDRSLLPVELLHFSCGLRRKTARSLFALLLACVCVFVLAINVLRRKTFVFYGLSLYRWKRVAWMNDINWAKIKIDCLYVCVCKLITHGTKSNCTDFDESERRRRCDCICVTFSVSLLLPLTFYRAYGLCMLLYRIVSHRMCLYDCNIFTQLFNVYTLEGHGYILVWSKRSVYIKPFEGLDHLFSSQRNQIWQILRTPCTKQFLPRVCFIDFV